MSAALMGSLPRGGAPARIARGNSTFLEVRRLCKRFGSTTALDDVSAQFFVGEIHCVLGENGAGKSTLAKIIGGVHHKDSGTILVDGVEENIGTVARARQLGIAVVFQELSLAADLSVRANMMLGTEPRRHPFAVLNAKEERLRTSAVLRALGVEVDTEARVRDLSVATQQIVEVAKAFIKNPRMLVLDEPTAMLNELEKRKLYAVLAKLRADGAAIALITHHLDDIEAMADRASVMRDGRLVESVDMSGGTAQRILGGLLSGAFAHVPRSGTPAAADRPLLRIQGLKGPDRVPFPLSLSGGQVCALYGLVGSGAEYIAQALCGVRKPALRIAIDGVPAEMRTPVQARRLGIAYLPTGRANNGLLPTRSIRENLNLLSLSRFSRLGVLLRSREASATESRLRAGAVKYTSADDDIVQLSGGNQQKVLVARVLAANARVYVLEDPTAGVDVISRQQIWTAIRARAEEGAAILLVSSDLEETLELADILYTLYAGHFVRRYATPQPNDRAAVVADVVGHDTS